mgnify:CR=1 FL=1
MAGARLVSLWPPKRRRDERLATYRARCEERQAEEDMRNRSALARALGTLEDMGPDLSVPRGDLFGFGC